jgi:signal transduction histidine kinase
MAEGLAHEVKNPIHAAVINLELLRRRLHDPDPARADERIDHLEREVARVHALVDAFFHFLRPAPDRAELLEIDEALGALMPVLGALGKVSRVEVDYRPAGSAIVALPRSTLQHAVLNLVMNAFEAMRPDGGRLFLRARRAEDEVRLEVVDSGPGVAPDALAKLGEPGFSTRAGHDGLGLAVARALLAEYGGRLELEEAGGGGRGARFVLAFRRARGA